jgi:hypothetical protein
MRYSENNSGTASLKTAMHQGCKIALPTYNGGKNGSGVYQTIINQQPPHRVFISAFLGHCGVLRNKRPAEFNIGSDIDVGIIERWIGLFGQKYRDVANFYDDDSLQFNIGCSLKYLSELRGKQRISHDWLIYCDPPYLMSTRSSGKRLYAHEMTDAQHLELLTLLKKLPCMVQISGYPSELYDRELAVWRKIEFDAMTRQGKKRECLWMNYPEPTQLHTALYVGKDYRERERIRRKAQRWVAKLSAMPHGERQFIIEALQSVNSGDAA